MKNFCIKITLILLQLSVISCGGGSAGCSVAVGALTCGSSNANNSNASPAPTSTFGTIHSMNSKTEGINPVSSLIEVNGIFYGTTLSGANGLGTVYSIPSNGMANSATIIHEFSGKDGDGLEPNSELTLGSDGNLYGTTSNGGNSGEGTVYKIEFNSGKAVYYGVIYSFSSVNDVGALPYGGLILGADNALYGTTYGGGIKNQGTIYRITMLNVATKIFTFDGGQLYGGNPLYSLIQDSTGLMYGTTTAGGNYGNGIVFSITNTGNFKKIADLSTQSSGSLLLASDGNLYGTTSTGNSADVGYVFKTGTNTNLNYTEYLSSSPTGPSGPMGKLVEIKGVIYGTSQFGGANTCQNSGCGTIFSIDTNKKELINIVDFSANLQSNGYNPTTGLVLGDDGYYYGTTINGGTTSSGTIFVFYP